MCRVYLVMPLSADRLDWMLYCTLFCCCVFSAVAFPKWFYFHDFLPFTCLHNDAGLCQTSECVQYIGKFCNRLKHIKILQPIKLSFRHLQHKPSYFPAFKKSLSRGCLSRLYTKYMALSQAQQSQSWQYEQQYPKIHT